MRFVMALGLALSILTGGAFAQEAPKVATAEPIGEPVPAQAATPGDLDPEAEDPADAPAEPAQQAPAPSAPAASAPKPATTPEVAAAPLDAFGTALKQRLGADADKLSDADKADREALDTFYAQRSYKPLWVSKTGFSPKAQAAIGEIKKADDWGLKASDFTLPAAPAANADDAALADAETVLSTAVLKYARYARGGRITDPAHQLSSYLDRMPQLIAPADVLAKIAASDTPDATLRGFNPQHPQFEKLRQKYLALRDAAVKDDKVRLPDSGPMLRAGVSHPDVALLRQRLKVAAPTATPDGKPADASYFDPALADAVKAFQKGKGLAPDGLVGRGTRAALNDFQVLTTDKLLANMEEWRWMPEDLGKFYVTVNIPEFTVRVIKDGQVIHSERVIAGKPDKQTPIFSETMKTIIAQPRWNVPNSIKVNELWPSLARGGEYFQRQGLRLTYRGRPIDPDDVDWEATDIRRFDVYQPPGPGNALGVVKFAFPNKHLVYMHDTPTKSLFDRSTRAFSHGCMRVRNPKRLAEILLNEDKGWDASKVDALIDHGPENNEVHIDRPIPVHVTYFTAWVDDNGETQMAADVYGHEQRIDQALAGKWDQIAKGPDHLAPVKVDPAVRANIARNKSYGSVGDLVQSILGGF
jgi:murein L,D-transpeptidase YcbB/YkuD